jgi:ABC-type antimicrobial peptide transport system permease subunit
MLLAGVLIVSNQINFLSSKDIGYKKDNLVKIEAKGGNEEYYNLFKNSLEQNPQILGVTGSHVGLPFFSWNITGFGWEGKDPNDHMSIAYNMVGYDFIKTFNMKMIEGRDFTEEFSSDAEHSVLINEEMAKMMGKESIVGKIITKGDESYTVVGVVSNFHFNGLNRKIAPLILGLKPGSLKNIYIKVNSRDFNSTLSFIKNSWKSIAPSFPFEYSMIDEEFNTTFNDTEQTAGLLNSFAIIALIISCLGLLSLSSFTTEQRKKEIGIRKVLGSSSLGVLCLLNKEYIVSLLIASAIAYPISYYFMQSWLGNFAYRIHINFLPFVIATGIAVIISLITISYQSIQAATANPVDSIKYE